MIIKVTPRHAYEDMCGGEVCRRYGLNPFANQHNKEIGGQNHIPTDLPPGKEPVPIV